MKKTGISTRATERGSNVDSEEGHTGRRHGGGQRATVDGRRL